MRIGIGRRARSSINYIRQTRVYQGAAAGIEKILPARYSQRISSTQQINRIMSSLNQAIELNALPHLESSPRLVDQVRSAEAESTRNIYGEENGEALNRIRESVQRFDGTPPTTGSLKSSSKKAFYLAMASAAFYGLGLLVSAPITSATLATAITITAAVSTFTTFAFGSLHAVHPTNPALTKIVENLRTRGMLGSLATSLLTFPYLIFRSNMDVTNFFGALPSWGIWGFFGAAGALTALNVIKACIDFSRSRMSMDQAPDKRKGINMLIWSKIAYYAKLGILSYIAPMYLAALYRFSAAISIMNPVFAATTVIGAYYIGKWALNYNQDAKDGLKNVLKGLAIGTTPLALAGGFSAAVSFPTLFLFAPICMLLGNFHAGAAAASSATSHMGSLFYPAVPPISDSFKEDISYGIRGGKGHAVIRLNAFMENKDVNFSNLINMLINPYPDVEFEFCEEKKPWANAGQLQAVRAMKDYMEHWKDWQKRIHAFVKEQYQRIENLRPKDPGYQGRLRKEYQRLAWVFKRLGDQLSREKSWEETDPLTRQSETIKPFLEELLELYEKDAQSKQKWFNHGLDPQFYAQGFQVMKARAQEFFFPLEQRMLRRLQEGGLARKELKKEYLRLLDIYSIRANYINRRLENLDDQVNQKTNNLSFVLVHSGDTLYKVWVVSKDGKEFYVEHIPAKYIRVDNPEYRHNDQDDAPPKYLWISREDAMQVNQPLRNSQASSEEIEFINNTPEILTRMIYKGVEMEAFASNHEVLSVKGLILRDFEKDGTSAGNRLQDKFVWAPGMEKSQIIGWNRQNREAVYTQQPDEFIHAFKAWTASKGDKYQENIPDGKLWYEDPEVLAFKAVDLNDYWFVSDEEYIDFSSYIQLQSELQHDAQRQKCLRTFRYIPNEHEIPYPCPERDPEHILKMERISASIEIGYSDENGSRQIIPYQENRILLPKGKIGSAGLTWEDVTHAKAARDENGEEILKLYSFTGKAGEEMLEGVNFHFINSIPKTDYPDHLPPPEMLKDQLLTFNPFPERVGMYGYYVFDFGKENYGKEPWQRFRFVREDKKPWQLWLNLITKMSLTRDEKLRIDSLYPEAAVVPFDRAWADPGKEGNDLLDVIEVSDSRKRVVAKYERADGSIYYQYAPSVEQLPKENRVEEEGPLILGKKSALGLMKFEKGGQVFESVVPLTGDLKGYQDPAKARDVIVGHLTEDGKVEVIQGRQFEYNPETAATYLYTLKDHAELVDPQGNPVKISNYGWIVDTYIEEQDEGYVVCVKIKNQNTKKLVTKKIDGSCFVDNEGVELLKNKSKGMDSPQSFFQKENGNYSPAVKRFRPEFALHEGLPTLRLRATQKERKIIDLPQAILEEILPPGAKNVEVYISSPSSAAQVREKGSGRKRWVPLSLVDPINFTEYMKGADFSPGKIIAREFDAEKGKYVEKVEYTENIQAAREEYGDDPQVSFEEAFVFRPDIIHGDFGMVVHRQNSFGGSDAAEVRDQYFYARPTGPGCEIRYPKGEFDDPRVVIGLQNGKTNIYDANRISHSEAIENGTPFMASYRILNELSNITGSYDRDGHLHAGNLESAIHHPFAQKLVTFSVFMGCLNGVSEDEELKKVMKKATGRQLRYSPYPTAVVAQPMSLGKVIGQNSQRYNTSAQLTKDIELGQLKRELWQGWIRHRMDRTFKNPKELLETVMTGIWYPGLPWAELSQMLGPSVYLFSGGNIQPYIVDHLMFLSFLLADTPLSGINYGLARYHGGFSPSWSFWHAPARDPLSMLGGYWRGSRRMMKEDWQYGQFIVTAELKVKNLPRVYANFLRYFYYSGGIANTLGWTALTAALITLGLSSAALFPMLAIFFNAGWGTYKFGLIREALKWSKIQAMDLKDNPQEIESLITKIEKRVNDGTNGRDRIFSLLEARHLAASTLMDLGFDPFEVRNDPSRNNEQLRTLLHQGFVIDHHLLEEAKKLGQSSDIEDRLQALTVLKHLGKQSFSHDIGYYATQAYKRVLIEKADISQIFNSKIQDLRREVNGSAIDLQQISTIYFMAAAAWDQLEHKKKHLFIRILRKIGKIIPVPWIKDKNEKRNKKIGRKLTKKIMQTIRSENIVELDDLRKLANIIGQVQSLLPMLTKNRSLLVRMIRKMLPQRLRRKDNIEKIYSRVREKTDAFQKELDLGSLSKEELNLLYSTAALGSDKKNIAQANNIKVEILGLFYEQAQNDYEEHSLPQYQGALSDLAKFSDKNHPLEDLSRTCERLIGIQRGMQLKVAERDTQRSVIEEEISKLREKLEEIREDLASGDPEKASEKLRALGRSLIDNIAKENSNLFSKLMDLQKEISILAPDKQTKARARKEIQKLLTQRLDEIEQIADQKERAKELKNTVEILTGYSGTKDGALSFESMPELKFIFKKIIPEFTPRIITIIEGCGSHALEIAIHEGVEIDKDKDPMAPDFGSFMDRALGLKQRRQKGFGLHRGERTARNVRRTVFENLLREARPHIEKAEEDGLFTEELGKLCDRLLKLLIDFRATKLAVKRGGIIDFVQKLLTLERNCLLQLGNGAEREKALAAYEERVETFKGAIKIFVDKKHLKKLQLADVYPVPEREITPKQKREINRYFHHIQVMFVEPAEGGN